AGVSGIGGCGGHGAPEGQRDGNEPTPVRRHPPARAGFWRGLAGRDDPQSAARRAGGEGDAGRPVQLAGGHERLAQVPRRSGASLLPDGRRHARRAGKGASMTPRKAAILAAVDAEIARLQSFRESVIGDRFDWWDTDLVDWFE